MEVWTLLSLEQEECTVYIQNVGRLTNRVEMSVFSEIEHTRSSAESEEEMAVKGAEDRAESVP